MAKPQFQATYNGKVIAEGNATRLSEQLFAVGITPADIKFACNVALALKAPVRLRGLKTYVQLKGI